jgi:transposase
MSILKLKVISRASQTLTGIILAYRQKYQKTPAAVLHDKLKEQFALFPEVDPRTVYNYVMMVRQDYGLSKNGASERQYSALPDLPPGQQAQVDFGEKKLRTSIGELVKVYFFIMLLSYSRQKFVYFLDKPFTTQEAVLALEKAFEIFKGIVKEII